ncbi:MAG TPA: glycogen synthase GlgA [Nitrospirota bacterium]
MKIAIVSPEVVPFAKTGGLADVAGALPKALARLGHEVVVVMPLYKAVDRVKHGLGNTGKTTSVRIDDRAVTAVVYEAPLGGNVKAYFIDKPDYYGRDQLYGTQAGDYPDNAERFIFFSKTVPEALKAVGFSPDVVHLNDWQSALVALYIKESYKGDPFFANTASVYTVHNLGYQGQFWAADMHLTGLGWEHFTPDGIEFYGDINLMKAGLVHADVISTVSKTYSREIRTGEYGHGMEGVLTMRKGDLYGIVNGIDYEEWDPEKDKDIYQTFGKGGVTGKLANKKGLKKSLGLSAGKKPLFGIITRLAGQKGLDILSESIPAMLKVGVQLVVLGTGEKKYHEILTKLAKKHPKQVSVTLGFDATLARRIYAGSDVFMMPSRYEPCGLGQLISLRYGAVPLVRKTGGLADTVRNYSPKTGAGNGFVFTGYSSRAFMMAVKAAAGTFQDARAWKKLVAAGMAEDHSWEQSAREYVKLYAKARAKAAKG